MAQTKAPVRLLKDIKFVTIHHSAEEPASKNLAQLKAKAKKWDAYHAKKDYDGNGTSDAQYTDAKFGYKWLLYHVLVARDGAIMQTQQNKFRRFHASDSARGKSSHNEYGIGICIDGNYSQFKLNSKQKLAVAKYIYELEKALKKTLIVRTHREQAVKVVGSKVYYPEKTGQFYTECAGNTIGTHSKGACKEIIDMVKAMHKAPVAPKVVAPPVVSTPKQATSPLESPEVAQMVKDAVEAEKKKLEDAHAEELKKIEQSKQDELKLKEITIKEKEEELKNVQKANQNKADHLETIKSLVGADNIEKAKEKLKTYFVDEDEMELVIAWFYRTAKAFALWLNNLLKK